jgi:Kef-type K+ transport system membrane component KefB
MAVILGTYRLLWPVFKKLGQVQVVAIMVAGFFLGPSLLGLVSPAASDWLFPIKLSLSGGVTIPHPSLTVIYVVGQLGLILYMFLVGTAFKVNIFTKHLRQAAGTSIAGVGVPLVLGGVVGWWLVSSGTGLFTSKVAAWQGGLFLASAVAITAFPMLAWIVYDSGLLNTRVGTMALSCAAADDACAWILLATVVATSRGSMTGAFLAIGGGLAYLVFMLTIGRKVLRRLETWVQEKTGSEETLPTGPLTITLLALLIGAWFTDYVGIYSVFGAFVLGTVMPRGKLITLLRDRLEPITAYLLLPAFFIYSGLNTRLSLIFDSKILLLTFAVLIISFIGKFGAVGLAAKAQGMSWREAGSMGALANARGLMELILLNIGLNAGLVTPALYTILSIMTIVTTFVATPVHRLFERSAWRRGLIYSPSGLSESAIDASPPSQDSKKVRQMVGIN